MKKPLADFTSQPRFTSGVVNFVRGTFAIVVALVLASIILHFAAVAYQFDRDGEIGMGRVVSTTEHTARRRRGRISISYELNVATLHHGVLSVSSDSRIPAGQEVQYIYSPTSRDVQIVPEPLKRGGMLRAYLCSPSFIVIAIGCLCISYYVYDQFWWVYVVASGRFTVKGKAVAEART